MLKIWGIWLKTKNGLGLGLRMQKKKCLERLLKKLVQPENKSVTFRCLLLSSCFGDWEKVITSPGNGFVVFFY